MRFKCVQCNKAHTTTFSPKDPYSRLVVTKWYKDDRGLDHYVAACLDCGAVHNTVPSFKILLGSPWRVEGCLMASSIVAAYHKTAEGQSFYDFASTEANLPDIVIDQLIYARHFPDPELT